MAENYQSLHVPDEALTVTLDAPFTKPCRQLTSLTSGAATIETVGGQVVTIYLNAGVPFSIAAVRVNSAGIEATGIVALF